MELDKEKIKNRFAEMNAALQEIQRLSYLPDNEFWSRKENMAAMKYYLLQTIEATGSVCAHIAAKKFNKGVSSFGECFGVLEKEGVLERNLSMRLKKMVKFRNKLIHRYWEIEDENILEYARNDSGDFRDFMKAVNKLLN